jgi:very-short-patch-repair endonuclease
MRRNFPYNPNLVARAQELRRNMTPAEKKLWYEFLSRHEIRFMRQRPIGNYIVDFYCASLKLAIEIDGDSHFSEEGKEYDVVRTAFLEGIGLKVMRFTNIEVLKSYNAVCAIIQNHIAE